LKRPYSSRFFVRYGGGMFPAVTGEKFCRYFPPPYPLAGLKRRGKNLFFKKIFRRLPSAFQNGICQIEQKTKTDQAAAVVEIDGRRQYQIKKIHKIRFDFRFCGGKKNF